MNPGSDTPVAYVMSSFTDDSENFHLATSVDGIDFTAVDGGQPLLRSEVGSRTMRDPFVGRDADGRFHLVATDGWRSRSIVRSTSDNLIDWTDAELIPLMVGVEGTLNTWAPEFFALASGEVRLIWSSTVSAAEADRDQPQNRWSDVPELQQIWQATTRDFVSFTAPSVFYSPGYTVIDASAYVDDDFSLLSFERVASPDGTPHKDIHLVALDPDGHPTGDSWPAGTPTMSEGPFVYRVGAELRLVWDLFTTPDYAALSSTDGRTWQPAALTVPPLTKHAAVLQLTTDEGLALHARLSD